MISSNDAFRNKLLEDNKAEEDAKNKKRLIQAKKKEKYRLRQRAINKANNNNNTAVVDDKDDELGGDVINIASLGYRDRVLERKKGISNEVNAAEADWEKYKKLTVNESMYLGGDESTTHLVKGLDIQLANRIKQQLINNKQEEEEQQQMPMRVDKVVDGRGIINNGGGGIRTIMGRGIEKVLFGQLHPNRYGIKYIIQKQTKMIGEMSINAKIKGSSKKFINGTCYYKMNIDPNDNEDIIPIEIYESVTKYNNNREEDDNKLYVSRYNEDILTQATSSTLRRNKNNNTIYKRKGGDYDGKEDDDNDKDDYYKNRVSIISQSKDNRKDDDTVVVVDNNVNIFEDNNNEDNNNDDKIWDKNNIEDNSGANNNNNNSYFDKTMIGHSNSSEIMDNNEVNKLTEAVHKHLVAKRIISQQQQGGGGGRGDFMSGGDYDECYVNYGELKGFGHDVGISKDILNNNKRRSNNNEGDDRGKKKCKMGETAQLKAVMKKVKEIEER